MKTILTVLLALSPLFVKGQDAFVDALVNFNTNSLSEYRDSRTGKFRIGFVLQTVSICQRLRVRIEQPAAVELDRIYAQASEKAAGLAERSPQAEELRLIPANVTRFVAQMISRSTPNQRGGGLVVTKETVLGLWDDIKSGLKKFCPCFPFC